MNHAFIHLSWEKFRRTVFRRPSSVRYISLAVFFHIVPIRGLIRRPGLGIIRSEIPPTHRQPYRSRSLDKARSRIIIANNTFHESADLDFDFECRRATSRLTTTRLASITREQTRTVGADR